MARGDGYSIIKRKRNGREMRNYEVRIQVPPAWQAAVGKKEALLSVGTGDRRIANMRAPEMVAQKYMEWRRLAGGPSLDAVAERRVPTQAELEQAAVTLGYELPTESANTARKTLRGKGAEFYNAHVNFVAAELAEQARAAATGDYEPVRSLAELAIEELGFDLVPDSEGYEKLCELLNVARLAGLQEQHRRNLGDVESKPQSELIERVRQRDASKASAGETLLELFERWSGEMLAKGAKRIDTVEQDRKVIERFSTFVGVDRHVRSITALEVAEYRDTMRDLPPKWMSKRELRDLDMRAAAERARKMDLPRTAFTNVNKHLSTISPLFKWLAKQPRWAGLRNPVDGLFYDGVKGRNRRPSFSTDTLNEIFGSPLFAGFKCDGEEYLPGEKRAEDWRKWIPLACLFTGARIGEIAQLRMGDVRQERGIWFIHIRHDQREGLSTKSGSSRPAAVHPILEELGFLAFHQRQLERADGDLKSPLFPELTPNARGQISGEPSRWWREYLKAIGIKKGSDGYGAHSFRHTLADRLRSEADLLDYQIAVCLGHSMKSTTAGYGELPQGTVNMLKSWMEAVRFEGVRFDHLVPSQGSETSRSSSADIIQ